MLDLAAYRSTEIAPMSPIAIEAVRRLAAAHRELPQVSLETRHVLHAGLYCRTILIPAGVEITGALIKIPTVVIVSGDCDVFLGEETARLTGYCVLPAAAQRQQAFLAHADTLVTMIFPSSARTVAQAEEEFTDEAQDLASRRPDTANTTIITGE